MMCECNVDGGGMEMGCRCMGSLYQELGGDLRMRNLNPVPIDPIGSRKTPAIV